MHENAHQGEDKGASLVLYWCDDETFEELIDRLVLLPREQRHVLLNQKDDRGRTVLYRLIEKGGAIQEGTASYQGYLAHYRRVDRRVTALFDLGADPFIKDGNGHTILDVIGTAPPLESLPPMDTGHLYPLSVLLRRTLAPYGRRFAEVRNRQLGTLKQILQTPGARDYLHSKPDQQRMLNGAFVAQDSALITVLLRSGVRPEMGIEGILERVHALRPSAFTMETQRFVYTVFARPVPPSRSSRDLYDRYVFGERLDESGIRALAPNELFTPDRYGRTVLHLVVMLGDVNLVQWVLQHPGARAHVNAADIYGMTPLHLAAAARDLEQCKTLVAQGGRLETRDHFKLTPIDIAHRNFFDYHQRHYVFLPYLYPGSDFRVPYFNGIGVESGLHQVVLPDGDGSVIDAFTEQLTELARPLLGFSARNRLLSLADMSHPSWSFLEHKRAMIQHANEREHRLMERGLILSTEPIGIDLSQRTSAEDKPTPFPVEALSNHNHYRLNEAGSFIVQLPSGEQYPVSITVAFTTGSKKRRLNANLLEHLKTKGAPQELDPLKKVMHAPSAEFQFSLLTPDGRALNLARLLHDNLTGYEQVKGKLIALLKTMSMTLEQIPANYHQVIAEAYNQAHRGVDVRMLPELWGKEITQALAFFLNKGSSEAVRTQQVLDFLHPFWVVAPLSQEGLSVVAPLLLVYSSRDSSRPRVTLGGAVGIESTSLRRVEDLTQAASSFHYEKSASGLRALTPHQLIDVIPVHTLLEPNNYKVHRDNTLTFHTKYAVSRRQEGAQVLYHLVLPSNTLLHLDEVFDAIAGIAAHSASLLQSIKSRLEVSLQGNELSRRAYPYLMGTRSVPPGTVLGMEPAVIQANPGLQRAMVHHLLATEGRVPLYVNQRWVDGVVRLEAVGIRFERVVLIDAVLTEARDRVALGLRVVCTGSQGTASALAPLIYRVKTPSYSELQEVVSTENLVLLEVQTLNDVARYSLNSEGQLYFDTHYLLVPREAVSPGASLQEKLSSFPEDATNVNLVLPPGNSINFNLILGVFGGSFTQILRRFIELKRDLLAVEFLVAYFAQQIKDKKPIRIDSTHNKQLWNSAIHTALNAPVLVDTDFNNPEHVLDTYDKKRVSSARSITMRTYFLERLFATGLPASVLYHNKYHKDYHYDFRGIGIYPSEREIQITFVGDRPIVHRGLSFLIHRPAKYYFVGLAVSNAPEVIRFKEDSEGRLSLNSNHQKTIVFRVADLEHLAHYKEVEGKVQFLERYLIESTVLANGVQQVLTTPAGDVIDFTAVLGETSPKACDAVLDFLEQPLAPDGLAAAKAQQAAQFLVPYLKSNEAIPSTNNRYHMSLRGLTRGVVAKELFLSELVIQLTAEGLTREDFFKSINTGTLNALGLHLVNAVYIYPRPDWMRALTNAEFFAGMMFQHGASTARFIEESVSASPRLRPLRNSAPLVIETSSSMMETIQLVDANQQTRGMMLGGWNVIAERFQSKIIYGLRKEGIALPLEPVLQRLLDVFLKDSVTPGGATLYPQFLVTAKKDITTKLNQLAYQQFRHRLVDEGSVGEDFQLIEALRVEAVDSLAFDGTQRVALYAGESLCDALLTELERKTGTVLTASERTSVRRRFSAKFAGFVALIDAATTLGDLTNADSWKGAAGFIGTMFGLADLAETSASFTADVLNTVSYSSSKGTVVVLQQLERLLSRFPHLSGSERLFVHSVRMAVHHGVKGVHFLSSRVRALAHSPLFKVIAPPAVVFSMGMGVYGLVELFKNNPNALDKESNRLLFASHILSLFSPLQWVPYFGPVFALTQIAVGLAAQGVSAREVANAYGKLMELTNAQWYDIQTKSFFGWSTKDYHSMAKVREFLGGIIVALGRITGEAGVLAVFAYPPEFEQTQSIGLTGSGQRLNRNWVGMKAPKASCDKDEGTISHRLLPQNPGDYQGDLSGFALDFETKSLSMRSFTVNGTEYVTPEDVCSDYAPQMATERMSDLRLLSYPRTLHRVATRRDEPWRWEGSDRPVGTGVPGVFRCPKGRQVDEIKTVYKFAPAGNGTIEPLVVFNSTQLQTKGNEERRIVYRPLPSQTLVLPHQGGYRATVLLPGSGSFDIDGRGTGGNHFVLSSSSQGGRVQGGKQLFDVVDLSALPAARVSLDATGALCAKNRNNGVTTFCGTEINLVKLSSNSQVFLSEQGMHYLIPEGITSVLSAGLSATKEAKNLLFLGGDLDSIRVLGQRQFPELLTHFRGVFAEETHHKVYALGVLKPGGVGKELAQYRQVVITDTVSQVVFVCQEQMMIQLAYCTPRSCHELPVAPWATTPSSMNRTAQAALERLDWTLQPKTDLHAVVVTHHEHSSSAAIEGVSADLSTRSHRLGVREVMVQLRGPKSLSERYRGYHLLSYGTTLHPVSPPYVVFGQTIRLVPKPQDRLIERLELTLLSEERIIIDLSAVIDAEGARSGRTIKRVRFGEYVSLWVNEMELVLDSRGALHRVRFQFDGSGLLYQVDRAHQIFVIDSVQSPLHEVALLGSSSVNESIPTVLLDAQQLTGVIRVPVGLHQTEPVSYRFFDRFNEEGRLQRELTLNRDEGRAKAILSIAHFDAQKPLWFLLTNDWSTLATRLKTGEHWLQPEDTDLYGHVIDASDVAYRDRQRTRSRSLQATRQPFRESTEQPSSRSTMGVMAEGLSLKGSPSADWLLPLALLVVGLKQQPLAGLLLFTSHALHEGYVGLRESWNEPALEEGRRLLPALSHPRVAPSSGGERTDPPLGFIHYPEPANCRVVSSATESGILHHWCFKVTPEGDNAVYAALRTFGDEPQARFMPDSCQGLSLFGTDVLWCRNAPGQQFFSVLGESSPLGHLMLHEDSAALYFINGLTAEGSLASTGGVRHSDCQGISIVPGLERLSCGGFVVGAQVNGVLDKRSGEALPLLGLKTVRDRDEAGRWHFSTLVSRGDVDRCSDSHRVFYRHEALLPQSSLLMRRVILRDAAQQPFLAFEVRYSLHSRAYQVSTQRLSARNPLGSYSWQGFYNASTGEAHFVNYEAQGARIELAFSVHELSNVTELDGGVLGDYPYREWTKGALRYVHEGKPLHPLNARRIWGELQQEVPHHLIQGTLSGSSEALSNYIGRLLGAAQQGRSCQVAMLVLRASVASLLLFPYHLCCALQGPREEEEVDWPRTLFVALYHTVSSVGFMAALQGVTLLREALNTAESQTDNPQDKNRLRDVGRFLALGQYSYYIASFCNGTNSLVTHALSIPAYYLGHLLGRATTSALLDTVSFEANHARSVRPDFDEKRGHREVRASTFSSAANPMSFFQQGAHQREKTKPREPEACAVPVEHASSEPSTSFFRNYRGRVARFFAPSQEQRAVGRDAMNTGLRAGISR